MNEIKPNDDKCHLIVTNQDRVSVTLKYETIEAMDSVDLLGITIDSNLNFNEHITNLCKMGYQTLHALARISKYLNENKLKILMKTFFQSQFNYCTNSSSLAGVSGPLFSGFIFITLDDGPNPNLSTLASS